MMSTGLIATIGAILVLVTSAGERLKNIFFRAQMIWLEEIVLDERLASSVLQFCMKTKSLSRFRSKIYFSSKVVLNNTSSLNQWEQTIAIDVLTRNTTMFWDGWTPIITSPGNWIKNPTTSYYERTVNLYLPRIKKNKYFIKQALEFSRNNSTGVKRHCVKTFHGTNKNAPSIVIDDTKRADHVVDGLSEVKECRAQLVDVNLSEIKTFDLQKPFNWYCFPKDVMKCVERARNWYKSRLWYSEKRIPWRRGWIVHGLPGSGKTLLLKCLSQELDLPIFIFDLPSMSNEEYSSYFQNAMRDVPCMVLFEDFDAVFDQRKNVVNNNLTFDCILNSISGIENADGVFLGITANDISKLDAAIGFEKDNGHPSRPGRIDEIICLDTMDEECRTQTAKNILGSDMNILDIVEKGDGCTAAQFVEMCNQKALKEMKNDKETKTRTI